MSLVQSASNEQLIEQEKIAVQEAQAPMKSTVITGLAGHVRLLWSKARDAKNMDVQNKLKKNALQFNSEYEPTILNEIRKLNGSEQYVSLTATKCNATIANIVDMYTGSIDEPWEILPTPKPELPADVEQNIKQTVIQEVLQIISEYAQVTQSNPELILKSVMPSIRKRINNKIMDTARDSIDEIKLYIKDQLVEGGWYEAIIQCIFDIVVYKAGILKGPIYRKKRYLKRVLQPNGTYTTEIGEKVIPMYERVSPFNFYPAGDATNIVDYYTCELSSLTIKQLSDLRGLEGFNSAAITSVLGLYKTGGLREWATYDPSMEEAQQGGNKTTNDTDNIDTVEFHGVISGKHLQDWGLTEAKDDSRQYDVTVWLIGSEVIKAMINPDPMGMKPYSMRSYIQIPGSVWGKGLAELIADLQQICNAMTRAIVNNAGIASGPLVEYNIDRMPPGFDSTLYPWKSIFSTSSAMAEGTPAVRFYQSKIVVEQLLRVFDFFSKLADQYTIPGFAHGDGQVGGAGKTATGFKMLTSMASKVLLNVVRNIDGMVSDSLKLLYTHNIVYNADKFNTVGDVQIQARGATFMMKKEEHNARKIEFLANTNNPTDVPLVGQKGRREILRDVAESIHIDKLATVFPEIDEIDGLRQELIQIMEAQGYQQEQGARIAADNAKATSTTKDGKKVTNTPSKKPRLLNMAGQPNSGQDAREFKQASVPQTR